jgi:hypothetical protein
MRTATWRLDREDGTLTRLVFDGMVAILRQSQHNKTALFVSRKEKITCERR